MSTQKKENLLIVAWCLGTLSGHVEQSISESAPWILLISVCLFGYAIWPRNTPLTDESFSRKVGEQRADIPKLKINV